MRLKLLCTTVATSVVVATGVVSPARPAQAALGNWFDTIINAVVTIVAGSGGGGGADAQIEAAKREIITAVETAKQEILNHIDAIANADVEACTEAAVTKLAQIDSMPPSLLGPFVNGAVDCASLSNAYFNVVQSLPAADNIGKLMGVIYSTAMVGFTKYGLSTSGLLDGLIRSYEAVVTRLKPTNCGMWNTTYDPELPRPRPGDQMDWAIWCQAYNGDYGGHGVTTYFPNAPTSADFEPAQLQAGRNTSYATAVRALPTLRAAR